MKRLVVVAVLAGLSACSTAKSVLHIKGHADDDWLPSETHTGIVIGKEGRDIAVFDPDHPESQDVWYRRSSDTLLLVDGKPMAWELLTEGTPVRVIFEPATGADQALRVEVLTGEAAEKMKARTESITLPAPPPNPDG